MDEAGAVVPCLEGRDGKQLPTAKRKRVRSGESVGEDSEDFSSAVPVTKKVSISDMELTSIPSGVLQDRVALLDAGAQYGKVWEELALAEE